MSRQPEATTTPLAFWFNPNVRAGLLPAAALQFSQRYVTFELPRTYRVRRPFRAESAERDWD